MGGVGVDARPSQALGSWLDEVGHPLTLPVASGGRIHSRPVVSDGCRAAAGAVLGQPRRSGDQRATGGGPGSNWTCATRRDYQYNAFVPFEVNDARTAHEAQAAIRDVLYLYYDLTKYRGFSGDHDIGTFNAWRFVNCEVRGGWLDPDDTALLHEGSAVALLSNLIDIWDQGGGDPSALREYASMLDAGRLSHLSLAETAMREGLNGEPQLMTALTAVYETYVLGRLRTLLDDGRAGP